MKIKSAIGIRRTTVELTDDVTTVDFGHDYKYFAIRNDGSGSIYVSTANKECTAGEDEVVLVPSGSSYVHYNGYGGNTGIYISGTGTATVVAQDDGNNPFKGAQGGGDYAVAGASSYTLNNAVDYPLLGLNLYGKSTQDGTPTPDAPIDIVSVGDSGSVTITVDNGDSVSISANITTALPLCGIPVDNYGNYTDSNGQQWICDELIYNADGTGKIIKRFGEFIVDGTESSYKNQSESTSEIAILDTKFEPIKNPKYVTITALVMSDIFKADTASNTWNGVNDNSIAINRYGTNLVPAIRVYSSKFTNIDDAKTYFTNNPMTFIAELGTPQEISLSAAEMAELRQLMTYSGITNISNDSGADMDVKVCTNKALSEFVYPITTGLQAQIDELKAAVISLGGNV